MELLLDFAKSNQYTILPVNDTTQEVGTPLNSAYIKQLEYCLLLMVYQYCQDKNGLMFDEYMSAGENAFDILGINNGDNADEVWKRIDEYEKNK